MSAIYAALEDRPAPPLSCRALAANLRVSRSHVGNLLAVARGERWFTTDGRGRALEMDPAFVAEFECWSAAQLAHHASIAEDLLTT
ncbi:hypothetical protein ACMGDH_15495 [Sphingomonas sp. DT-207]